MKRLGFCALLEQNKALLKAEIKKIYESPPIGLIDPPESRASDHK